MKKTRKFAVGITVITVETLQIWTYSFFEKPTLVK